MIKAVIFLLVCCAAVDAFYMLEVEPSQLSVIVAEGVERVSVLAEGGSAINGGFYHVDGSPAGALKVEGIWLGATDKPRAAFGWGDERVMMDQVLTFGDDLGPLLPRHTQPEDWEACEWIVGGAGLLVWDGEVVDDWELEQIRWGFLYEGHHRTAVGLLENGKLLLVVVDERIDLPEMAHLMQELGCLHAVNLDGGGSSTMVIDGVMVNHPSDRTGERAVGDVILIQKQVES